MSKHILRETLAVRRNIQVNANNLKDQVVAIQRVTKVVKGGKNLSFSALVVVGDQAGNAGFGMGKAREVPMAIRKAIEQAKKNLIRLNLKGTSIPHQVTGFYCSGQVLLKPASEGTGIIAGGPVRAVMEVAGIRNVLTKSIGTSNPHNVIKATFDALLRLKDVAKVAALRSKTVEALGRQPRRERTWLPRQRNREDSKSSGWSASSAARRTCGRPSAVWGFAECSKWWSATIRRPSGG